MFHERSGLHRGIKFLNDVDLDASSPLRGTIRRKDDVGGVRMRKLKKTDPGIVTLINDLKNWSRKNDAPVWRDIAKRLEKPSRVWPEVNVSRISLYVHKGETIIVPGKVLGAGEIDFPVTVATYKASKQAVEKITAAGGSVLTIPQLVEKNPKGKKVRIMG
jgi:large subunit ribosomal protein L18e